MIRALAIVVLFLVVGCVRPPAEPTPTDTLSPGEHYVTDPKEMELEAVYDLLRADFRELNGSVVLELEFRDVYSPIPKLLAVFAVEANETSYTYFARSAPDLSRPPPHVKWEMGRLEDGEEKIFGEICTFSQSTNEPYLRQLDLPNNWTDLLEGGQITRLHVDVRDFENDTLHDTAEAAKVLDVRGGANPHDTCPLIAERER